MTIKIMDNRYVVMCEFRGGGNVPFNTILGMAKGVINI